MAVTEEWVVMDGECEPAVYLCGCRFPSVKINAQVLLSPMRDVVEAKVYGLIPLPAHCVVGFVGERRDLVMTQIH
jgi:hypothetical protein